MKFLAVSTNTGDPTAHLAEESARMDELVRSGAVERVLLKADSSGAVLLLDAADLPAAQASVDRLPLVRHGITTFALTPVLEPGELPSGAGVPGR